jgi:hypothetical protein
MSPRSVVSGLRTCASSSSASPASAPAGRVCASMSASLRSQPAGNRVEQSQRAQQPAVERDGDQARERLAALRGARPASAAAASSALEAPDWSPARIRSSAPAVSTAWSR